MVRLTARRRCALGGTVRELANYGAAAMVFGQFLAAAMFSTTVATGGMALWVVRSGGLKASRYPVLATRF